MEYPLQFTKVFPVSGCNDAPVMLVNLSSICFTSGSAFDSFVRLARPAINRAFAVSTRVPYRSRRVQLTTARRYVCPCEGRSARPSLFRCGGIPLDPSAGVLKVP